MGLKSEEKASQAQTRRTDRFDSLIDGLTVRRARVQDAHEIAALFQSMYRDSSHPFHSTAAVAGFLEDTRNFQILAEVDNRVVASLAMTCNSWNDSYELGRAITVAEYRRNGLAGFLMQQVVDWVAAERLGEVIFGYPRVRRIVELCLALDPTIVPVGHDAGRNVANGSRETHLIVCGIPRHAQFTHVAPMDEELLKWPFVRERIYAPLGLCGIPGRYPPECFVGPPSSNSIASDSWILGCSPGASGGALEVLRRRDNALFVDGAIAELDQIATRLPDVQHVTATVLADKISVIKALVTRGFELTAYLPAWFRRGYCRYDCIQLVRRQYNGSASTQDLPDLLGELEAALRSCPLLCQPAQNTQASTL